MLAGAFWAGLVDGDVPGRKELFVSSVIFCCASLLLLLEFTTIYFGVAQAIYYAATPAPWASAALVNGLGAASCVGWVVGFVLLIDWFVFSTFPKWGFNRRALAGATIKLIAACFFNVQPWGWIIAPTYGCETSPVARTRIQNHFRPYLLRRACG